MLYKSYHYISYLNYGINDSRPLLDVHCTRPSSLLAVELLTSPRRLFVLFSLRIRCLEYGPKYLNHEPAVTEGRLVLNTEQPKLEVSLLDVGSDQAGRVDFVGTFLFLLFRFTSIA